MTSRGTVPPTCDETEEPLVHTVRAAELLGVSQSWLEKDRLETEPKVPFVRIGRAVRYHQGTLRRLRGDCDE